jgi:hypothetical protein
MAMCEKCQRPGFYPHQLHANEEGTKLLGPCCLTDPKQLPPVPNEMDIDWGVAFTSKKGLEVFANVGDLRLKYTKTPQEIKKLADSIR